MFNSLKRVPQTVKDFMELAVFVFFPQRLLSSQRSVRSLSGSGAPAVEAQTAADLFGDDDLEVTRQTELFLEDRWNCPVTRQLRDFANLNMAEIGPDP